MSKKITQQEFFQRYYRNFPETSISLLEYTAISKPAVVKCNKCGKEKRFTRAREILTNFRCCGANNKTKIECLQELYKANLDFTFVKQSDSEHYIVHCNKCGNDLKRPIQSGLDNPFACTYCNTRSTTQLLSIQAVQEDLNKQFNNTIQILEYKGQLQRNLYKCLKCGLIFKQQHTSLLQSRGCPKCDKYKLMGERKVANFLREKQVSFEEQVKVEELPRQSFDFALYDSANQLIGFIEVQGEQHFEKRDIFRDNLEVIQARDTRKRLYCKEKDIPFYELIYKKGKILNFDILPF